MNHEIPPLTRKASTARLEAGKKDRILKGEESKTGKLFANVLRFTKGKEIQYNFVSFYSYIRGIEDIVDNGSTPNRARPLVLNEIRTVQQMRENGGSQPDGACDQTRYLFDGLRTTDNPVKRDYLLRATENMLTGIYLDNESIATGKPLPENFQRERDLYESMSGFEVLSALTFDRPLNGKGEVEDLFRTWIRYDALRDLDEDLAAGLTLFPQRTLDQYGIALTRDELIPEPMRDLFEDQKIEVSGRLRNLASAIFTTSLPQPYSTALYGYFRSRIGKLRRTEYPIQDATRFAQNRIEQ